MRATEDSAQDWIRRIDNKQSRTRGGRDFLSLPARNFLRIARVSSFRASRGRSLDVGAGRGKKRENIYTDDRGSRRIARWGGRGRAKGKDLNGLSQKAFSYSPWQTTMAKWREREHILNRFPSSVPRCIYVAHENQRRSARLPYVYTASMLSERTRLFFLGGGGGEVSNLKGLKRFPRRVARRIVGPRTPIDRRRLFLAPVALDPPFASSRASFPPFRL